MTSLHRLLASNLGSPGPILCVGGHAPIIYNGCWMLSKYGKIKLRFSEEKMGLVKIYVRLPNAILKLHKPTRIS